MSLHWGKNCARILQQASRVVLMILCENPVFDSLSAFEQVIRIQFSFVAKNRLADFDLFAKELKTIKNREILKNFVKSSKKRQTFKPII